MLISFFRLYQIKKMPEASPTIYLLHVMHHKPSGLVPAMDVIHVYCSST